MGIEYFTDNHASIGSGGSDENNELAKCNFASSLTDSQPDSSKVKDDIFNGDNMEHTEGESRSIDVQHILGTDFDSESVGKPSKMSVESIETVTIDEKMNSSNGGVHGENKCRDGQKESTSSHMIDGSPVSGVKRARMTCTDQQPLVRIRYEFLSSESKRKLEELLNYWSEWHAQKCSSSKDSKEVLESGDETYFPALHVGPEKSSTVSFVMDDQVEKKQMTELISFNGDTVPLYDREYAFALTSANGSINLERGLGTVGGSRCFNCGSYNHSLKECPKPRDNVAVSNARKQHQSKRSQTAGPRVITRYYQNSPRGKYDGLKPGALDAETRKLLGVGELDPPPWLNRMREMGYPPGYMDGEDEDQPSGIKIYADEETKEHEEIFNIDISESQKNTSVDFPGINAPIPENADQSCWAAPQRPPSFNSSTNLTNHRSNCSPEFTPKGHSYYQRLPSGSMDGSFASYSTELSSFMSDYSRNYRDLSPNHNSGAHGPDSFSPNLHPNHNSDPRSPHSFSPHLAPIHNNDPRSPHSFSPHLGPNHNREPRSPFSFSPHFPPNHNSESHSPFTFSPHVSPNHNSESPNPHSLSPYSLPNSRH